MAKRKRRMVLLTEGHLGVFHAKTAVSLLRYRPDECVCVLDSRAAGQDLEKLIGIGAGVPIVATLKESLRYKPNTLLLGIAPSGGRLPREWRAIILQALAAGLDIVSGLHVLLNDDTEIARAAKRHGCRIWDVRWTPAQQICSRNVAKDTKCKRVLTVGSDACLGKMSVALELTAEAQRRGWDAEFVATGQTGMMIAGSGLPIDHYISDFVNGAAEQLVLERKRREILFIEGQGSIAHPAYSAVSLGLLHGCAPDAMILCHLPTRKYTVSIPAPIQPLPALIRLHEDLARIICPSKVVGIGMNTFGMSDAKARAAIAAAERETGLPAADVYRSGAGKLMDAVERYYGRK
jgi:uncharacterized NAD-dependent epimerase/dehydratase family protein